VLGGAVSLSLVLPLPYPRRGVVTWPIAPAIHPVSSGSQGWGRVLGWRLCVAFVRAGGCCVVVVGPPLPSPSCTNKDVTCSSTAGSTIVVDEKKERQVHDTHRHRQQLTTSLYGIG
jgi:hypothetical protein